MTERLEGNATTDFGAPDIAPSSDIEPVNSAELQRLQRILKACWRTFDANVRIATGKALRTGPRGGGRELEGIIQHILGSDGGYLAQLGWKLERADGGDLDKQLDQTRQAILRALASAGAHATSSGAWPGTCSITLGKSRTAYCQIESRVYPDEDVLNPPKQVTTVEINTLTMMKEESDMPGAYQIPGGGVKLDRTFIYL